MYKRQTLPYKQFDTVTISQNGQVILVGLVSNIEKVYSCSQRSWRDVYKRQMEAVNDVCMAIRGALANNLALRQSRQNSGMYDIPQSCLLYTSFYVLDEAKTIPESIFTAVSRCTLFNAFITSSPGADSGTFYDCFHKNSSLYYKSRVKYERCV